MVNHGEHIVMNPIHGDLILLSNGSKKISRLSDIHENVKQVFSLVPGTPGTDRRVAFGGFATNSIHHFYGEITGDIIND